MTYGKYIIEHNGVRRDGLTAAQVRETLESQASAGAKVYKVHAVRPDGTVEMKGMPRELFELESGMFFHTADLSEAERVYGELASLADSFAAHCKCSIALSKAAQQYVASLIYAAECEDEISAVLLEADVRFDGAVSGGASAVSEFYAMNAETLKSKQAIAGAEQTAASEKTA